MNKGTYRIENNSLSLLFPLPTPPFKLWNKINCRTARANDIKRHNRNEIPRQVINISMGYYEDMSRVRLASNNLNTRSCQVFQQQSYHNLSYLRFPKHAKKMIVALPIDRYQIRLFVPKMAYSPVSVLPHIFVISVSEKVIDIFRSRGMDKTGKHVRNVLLVP